MVKIKRIYDPPAGDDGVRVLVDRLWPRGLTKEQARVDHWLKGIAPSSALREWYDHDPAKWPEFQKKYAEELKENPRMNDLLDVLHQHKVVTFLYSSKEERFNNATALRGIVAMYI